MNSLFIAILVCSLSSIHDPVQAGEKYLPNDTTINHVLDGKLNEWPAQKFESDPGSEFKYAIDNDKQNLFLVLTIPTLREQMKIMQQGMHLYLDPKGKKKEGKGIEFPVKRDQSAADMLTSYRNQENENAAQETPEQRKTAMRAMRAEMALTLSSMKVFGFSEDKSEEQGLVMPGSANIAFAWDSADAMNIEYRIPLSFFAGASPGQKDISVGWKVNGFQFSSGHSGESSGGGGRHGGGGYGGGRHGGGGYGGHGDSNSQQGAENMMKDQNVWTKYTFKE